MTFATKSLPPAAPHTGGRFDAFTKVELAALLSRFGTTESSVEVLPNLRLIDLGFTAHDNVTAVQMEASLGLLGRIAFKHSLFEPFSTRLTAAMLARVGEKYLMVQSGVRRHAAKGRITVPRMWVLTPTASKALLKRVHATPRVGWPEGVVFMPPPLSLGIVVIHALPPTPETLWIRLVGRGQVQKQAFEELAALPDDAPFRREVLALAMSWRTLIQEGRATMTRVERELWNNSTKIYEQLCDKLRVEGLREGKSEGLREGEAKGLRAAVRDLCDVLEIPITAEREQMLASLGPEGLESLRVHIKRAHCW